MPKYKIHSNDCEKKNTSNPLINFANIPDISPHNFKIINFWNKFLILSNRWTQTDRERKIVAHVHPQENTPEGWGFLLRGSTAVVRETAPAAFEYGSSFMVQWSCCKDTQPMFWVWKENKSLVCPFTLFFWTDECIIFLENTLKTCLIF